MSRQAESDSNVTCNLYMILQPRIHSGVDERTVLLDIIVYDVITLSRTSGSHEFLISSYRQLYFFHLRLAAIGPPARHIRRNSRPRAAGVESCLSFPKTSKQHQRQKRVQDQILHQSKELKKMSPKLLRKCRYRSSRLASSLTHFMI